MLKLIPSIKEEIGFYRSVSASQSIAMHPLMVYIGAVTSHVFPNKTECPLPIRTFITLTASEWNHSHIKKKYLH